MTSCFNIVKLVEVFRCNRILILIFFMLELKVIQDALCRVVKASY